MSGVSLEVKISAGYEVMSKASSQRFGTTMAVNVHMWCFIFQSEKTDDNKKEGVPRTSRKEFPLRHHLERTTGAGKVVLGRGVGGGEIASVHRTFNHNNHRSNIM